jgi:hypothetical protein
MAARQGIGRELYRFALMAVRKWMVKGPSSERAQRRGSADTGPRWKADLASSALIAAYAVATERTS